MKTLTVPADADRLYEVNAFVNETLRTEGCSEETRLAIELAVEEVFLNIASYAYRTPDGGTESPGRETLDSGTKEPGRNTPDGRTEATDRETPDGAEKHRAGIAEVRCEVLRDPPRAAIQFLDWGAPFDPTAGEDADTSREALMNRVGGLGILLVRRTMDEVRYAQEDGRNILSIIKRL